MSKDNEISTSIALSTFRICDITAETIQQIESDDIINDLARMFINFWNKMWRDAYHDNYDWVPFEDYYTFEDFVNAGNALCERLKNNPTQFAKNRLVQDIVEKCIHMWGASNDS